MEIISIPLSGSLRHEDSMGNRHIIKEGEVQRMSTGSGLTHSEYNNFSIEKVNLLQIWVMPKERDTPPSYSQKLFEKPAQKNQFQFVVALDERGGANWINQDARLNREQFHAPSLPEGGGNSCH